MSRTVAGRGRVGWRPRVRRWICVAAASCASALCGVPAAAQAQATASEAAVKAAFVIRFVPFVDWPAPPPTAPLVIGVFAPDELAQHIAALAAGRRLGHRELQVRRVHSTDAADDLDVIFVGYPLRRSRLSDGLKGRPVLVVTDQGLGDLGMLNLVPVDGRIGFEASTVAAERAGLRLGSRLLAIAERVVR